MVFELRQTALFGYYKKGPRRGRTGETQQPPPSTPSKKGGGKGIVGKKKATVASFVYDFGQE